MKNSDCAIPKAPFWSGFAASIPGGGHIRRGIPCQDASSVFTEPRPAAIVCDGRGSASLSHFGAQEAVKVFHFQVSVLNPYLENILDSEEKKEEQWIKFCRIMYRTLMQVKYDLAEKHHTNEKEFDCTVAFAVTGSKYIGCFQVGDGSIVLRQNGICKTVFIPEKGEFANQTHFLRAGGEEKMKFQYALFRTEENSGIAITSDGPEHLMFHLSDMTPGKIFDSLFDDLHKEELCRQDIMDYLTRREWADDPRGSDDRSLAVLARIGEEEKSLPEPKISENVIETTAIMPEEDEVKPIPAEKSAVPEPHDTETSAEPEKDNAAVNVKKKVLMGWTPVLVSSLVLVTLMEAGGLLAQHQTIVWQRQEIQRLLKTPVLKTKARTSQRISKQIQAVPVSEKRKFPVIEQASGKGNTIQNGNKKRCQ